MFRFESNFIQKYFDYGLHVGGRTTFWNPSVKPFLMGFRNGFCIFNPVQSILFFKKAFRYLMCLMMSNKKILFIGVPFGLEKEFMVLCSTYGHYVFSKKQKILYKDSIPSLVFVISQSSSQISLKELKDLHVPIMGFLSTNDDFFFMDFPLLGNVNSTKGGLFIYNFFFFLFKNYKK